MGAARPDGEDLDTIAADSFASSSVVSRVFDQVLESIHDGVLLPGQRISDTDLADELGVSRTPVREALQRLREIGVIEAAASRFTRVAIVSPEQTAQSMVVWVALYRALVTEIIDLVPQQMVVAMKADHERFKHAEQTLQMRPLATANADFFHHLETLSANPALQRAISSVAHVIRLGSLHLPDYVDFRAIGQAQELLLAAIRDRDRAAAHGALRMLGVIALPTPEPELDPGADHPDADTAVTGNAAGANLPVGFLPGLAPATEFTPQPSDPSEPETLAQRFRRRRGRR